MRPTLPEMTASVPLSIFFLETRVIVIVGGDCAGYDACRNVLRSSHPSEISTGDGPCSRESGKGVEIKLAVRVENGDEKGGQKFS
jgi:hypothetical protein